MGDHTLKEQLRHIARRGAGLALACAMALAALPLTAHAAGPTYNGSATGIIANLLGSSVTRVDDTGPLPATGGSITTGSTTGVNLGVGKVTADVLPSSTSGSAGTTNSSAQVTNAGVNVLTTLNLSAGVVKSSATATCGANGATASGSSTVTKLVINGSPITVTGDPNQTVPLLGVGKVVINEQIPSSTGPGNKTLTVNALHVMLLNPAVDVVFAQSVAGITCSGNPTAATYGRLSVRTVHALHTLRWHAARHVLGFNVFAGSIRLDSRLITSNTAWYHFSTRHNLAGLRIVPVFAH